MSENNNEETGARIISTGQAEINKKLGGGIPVGSLVFIEGQSDAGKSVLCQQMAWGSLNSGFKVVMFTTENTISAKTAKKSCTQNVTKGRNVWFLPLPIFL